MGYKTWGVAIEGLGATASGWGPLIWRGGMQPAGTTFVQLVSVSTDFRSLVSTAEVGLAPPQLSASELDPLTGSVRAGAVQLRLSATAEVCAALLSQARARRPDTVLQTAVDATLDELDLVPAPTIGASLHIGEETVWVLGPLGGDTYSVVRAIAGTTASAHEAGTNCYERPTYWAGRSIWIVELELDAARAVTSERIVWRGVLSEPPNATQSTGQVTLRAEAILGTLKRAKINRAPQAHSAVDPALVPYAGTKGVQVYGEIVPDNLDPLSTSVRKTSAWAVDGRWKAMQLGSSVVLTRAGLTYDGFPALSSPQFKAGERVEAPYWELAVWSEQLDQLIFDATGDPGVSPTIACAYPYHPLTIAAAILFSSTSANEEDPLVYDVLAPQLSLGVPWLADYDAWDDAIAATAHIKVGLLVLAWDGKPESVWSLVTEQLLPAYGFALSEGAGGKLKPIEIGLVDVGQYAAAPLVTPLPEVWEWTPSAFGALDQIVATIGATPWQPGRRVQVTGEGVRIETAGRASRILNPASVEVDWPTLLPASAEAVGATQIASRLVWRYDGLPVVTAVLPATQSWELGQIIRIARPDGLISSILFDEGGARVDDLWETVSLVAQIVSLRPDIERGRYEVKLLLTNYTYGRTAKWRAPAVRIKSRTGSGTYLIEGGSSDFSRVESDALTLTSGDQVALVTANIAPKASPAIVNTITPSGLDWAITLNAEFSVIGAAGDWIQLADSTTYTNTNVVTGEPYPYTWMTDQIALDRPGSTTTDPDEYS